MNLTSFANHPVWSLDIYTTLLQYIRHLQSKIPKVFASIYSCILCIFLNNTCNVSMVLRNIVNADNI